MSASHLNDCHDSDAGFHRSSDSLKILNEKSGYNFQEVLCCLLKCADLPTSGFWQSDWSNSLVLASDTSEVFNKYCKEL